jgi:hypothetical protein
MSWIDRIKSPIQGGTIDPPKQKSRLEVDPVYDSDMEFRERVLTHSHSVSGIKRDVHQKHRIGMRSNRRKCFDHYCGSDTPHCVECGEADRRVLILHHVNGRKKYPSTWADIVAEGFPEDWLRPLCRNCHARQHDLKFKWEPRVYK